jgi:hypothetical protein
MNDPEDYSVVMTTIHRNQIEAGDLNVFLEILRGLNIQEPEHASVQRLRGLQSKIGFLIDGYNDDPRELFQIPEVRKYFQQIQAVWPFGLYFFNNEANTLLLLVLCHVEPKIEKGSQQNGAMLSVPTDKVIEFLNSSAPPIFSVAARVGWTPEQAVHFLGEIASRLGVCNDRSPAPESAEERRRRHSEFIRSAARDIG